MGPKTQIFKPNSTQLNNFLFFYKHLGWLQYFQTQHKITSHLLFSIFIDFHHTLLSNDLPQGHLRSQRGHRGLLPITFDRVKIEKWKWRQCLCLVQTHRSIWNVTYLSDLDLDRDLDLRSNFENDLSRSSSICSEPHWREKHDGGKIFVLALLGKSYQRKMFSKKTAILDFMIFGA